MFSKLTRRLSIVDHLNKRIQKLSTRQQPQESADSDLDNQKASLPTIPFQRYRRLNHLLPGGGHRAGELTLITGPANSGKTTLAAELALDLCASPARLSTVWCSLGRNHLNMELVFVHQLLRSEFFARHSSEKPTFGRAFTSLAALPLYFMHIPLKKQVPSSVDQFLEQAELAVESPARVEHIVVDNVDRLLETSSSSALPQEEKCHQETHLLEQIRAFAHQSKCHVTLVSSVLNRNSATDVPETFDHVMRIVERPNAHYHCSKYVNVSSSSSTFRDSDSERSDQEEIAQGEASGGGLLPLYFDSRTLCFSGED